MKRFTLYLCILLQLAQRSQAQLITKVAGGGTDGLGAVTYSGPALNAVLVTAEGLAPDPSGNILLADWYENIIRRIDASGNINTIIGTRFEGFAGDGGAATAALTSSLHFVTSDPSGTIYFCDKNRIRKVNSAGIISTIAGADAGGFSGDGGPANAALLDHPEGIAADGAGNIYFADANNNRIRKINAAGIITTIAGTGIEGYSGDGSPAAGAMISYPSGLALDGAGNIYFSDGGILVATGGSSDDPNKQRVRKISTSGIISTIAGNGHRGYSGDGGPATDAMIGQAVGIATDAAGNVYFADYYNSRLRKISTSGTITTIAGNGGIPWYTYVPQYGRLSTMSPLTPWGVMVDASGNVYCTDHTAISKITPATLSITASTTPDICVGTNVTFSVLDTGSGPHHYQWQKNCLPVGTDSINYSTSGLADSDIINVVRLSGAGGTPIAISNVITMFVYPRAGQITGPSRICNVMPRLFTESVAGGTWSLSNVNASVTSAGWVTGLLSGYDTLIYTVTDTCGTMSTQFPLVIDTNAACPTGVVVTSVPEFKLFPNPASNELIIEHAKGNTLHIYNLLGQKVFEAAIESESSTFSIGNLTTNCYIVRIFNSDGNSSVQRLIVTK